MQHSSDAGPGVLPARLLCPVLQKLTYNVAIALDGIVQNKVRALLTSLGIIFGVASVIAMLAIGQGAEQEILKQIRILGANNVIVRPVVEQTEEAVSETGSVPRQQRRYSPGLTQADARSVADVVPGVESVSPEVVVETNAVRAGLRRSTKLVGVTPAYFQNADVQIADGRGFAAHHIDNAVPVAIIGHDVKTKFFPRETAVGNRIKCGRLWLTVVGVMEKRTLTQQSMDALGIRNYNLDIYTPLPTMLLRFADRARVTAADVERAERETNNRGNDDSSSDTPTNYHQLDRLVIRSASSDLVAPIADVVNRMLERRHNQVVDYQVVVPEQLLKQERRTQTIFNVVLAAIASISLIVGGIGIMNIMLASVMERIREIGVRRAVGATQRDIVLQFLIESLALSCTGGVLGVLLGVGLSLGIEAATGIPTIVAGWAVALAFIVSAGVGLVFGLWPAKRAAERDPVEALRHE